MRGVCVCVSWLMRGWVGAWVGVSERGIKANQLGGEERREEKEKEKEEEEEEEKKKKQQHAARSSSSSSSSNWSKGLIQPVCPACLSVVVCWVVVSCLFASLCFSLDGQSAIVWLRNAAGLT
jgi:hypothetical protein